MGIKQLTSYVRDNFATLYKDEFYLRGQKLVFDGGALYYGLLRNCDKRFGGDYYHIYHVFKTYFVNLKEIGVTPYIVLDGGSNIPLKNTTISERFNRDVKALRNLTNMKTGQYNLPKPRLLKLLLIEVLIELRINYVVAKGEADMLVATLANRLGCPLVSGDSDFFVVPVLHGVLPLDPLLSIKSNTNKCVRFRSSHMADHLKIKEILLPMLAVIMGNDYSEEIFLDRMQTHCKAKQAQVQDKVRSICRYLSPFDSIESVIADICGEDTEFMDHVESVLGEFDLNCFEEESDELFPILNCVTSFSEKITPVMKNDIPVVTFLKHIVYHGIANPCVLDIYYHFTHFIRPQCENSVQKASSDAAEKLRTYLYVLLLHRKANDKELNVSEFKKIGQSYGEACIQVSLSEWSAYYPIDIINNNYSKMERISIFCKLIGFPVDSMVNVKEEDQLFLISVRYWIQQSADTKCNLKVEHVQALVLCYVQLKSGQHLKRCDYLDLASAHHYCRWQSIVFYLALLNVVFRFPFVPPIVSKIFHGNHVHSLHQLLDSGTDIYKLMSSGNESDIFNIFMEVITRKLEPSCLIYKRNNLKRPRNEQPGSSSNSFRPQYGDNRFAVFHK